MHDKVKFANKRIDVRIPNKFLDRQRSNAHSHDRIQLKNDPKKY